MAEALVAQDTENKKIDERDNDAVAERIEHASEIVKKYMYWGGGAGLLPVPLLDLVLLTAAQTKMLAELTQHYGQTWQEKVGRNVVTSLASGLVTFGLTRYITSLFKAVPGAGAVAGVITQTAAGAAFTYAVGRVFILHYETGGTLTSFDPKKVRAYFEEVYADKLNGTASQQRVSYAGVKP